jgi:flavin-dependent dehydrogenase
MFAPGPDVVVVGGGPAGAHLALRLAARGHSVVVLDRKRFPRSKPCGEFMSPECLPLLAELGLADAVLARGAHRVAGMDLYGCGRIARGAYAPVGRAPVPFGGGYALRREVLDELSLRAAARAPGVEVREGCRIEGLLRAADGAVLGVCGRDAGNAPFEVRARFTVGADGPRSRVAGELGVRRAVPWLCKFALATRYRGVAPRAHAEVHFFPRGYFAASAVDGGQFTINLVVDRARLPQGRAQLDALFDACLQEVPALRERLAGAERARGFLVTGPLAGRTTRQTFDGAALVGDACGYVDPVTGEGLFAAMRGAALLAETLDAALRAGRTDRRGLDDYVRARRRELAPRALLSTWLQRGLRHPAIVKRVMALLAARPHLTELLVAITGDYVPGRELLRPSVWYRALTR